MKNIKPCRCCAGTGDEIDNEKIGLALSGLRLRARIGLREMARLLDISHSFLCQLEKGNRTWTDDLRIRYHKQINLKGK